jgi:hypothetical protein
MSRLDDRTWEHTGGSLAAQERLLDESWPDVALQALEEESQLEDVETLELGHRAVDHLETEEWSERGMKSVIQCRLREGLFDRGWA